MARRRLPLLLLEAVCLAATGVCPSGGGEKAVERVVVVTATPASMRQD